MNIRVLLACLLFAVLGCESMGWFGRLFGGDKVEQPSGPDLRGVKIHILNGQDFFGEAHWQDVSSLEDALAEAIGRDGEVDGNEIATDGREVIIYVYGADAEGLWRRMRPVLTSKGPAPSGSYVIIQKERAGDGTRLQM